MTRYFWTCHGGVIYGYLFLCSHLNRVLSVVGVSNYEELGLWEAVIILCVACDFLLSEPNLYMHQEIKSTPTELTRTLSDRVTVTNFWYSKHRAEE